MVADIDLARAETVANDIGGETTAIAFDGADAESIEAMINKAVSHYGRLDILHNNAALTAPEIGRQAFQPAPARCAFGRKVSQEGEALSRDPRGGEGEEHG